MSLNSRFHPCTYFKHGNSEVEVFSYDTELENCWFKLNRNSKNNYVQAYMSNSERGFM
jgi:hypothetical protein